jgi:Arc/MetJ family transcription regulator
MGEVRAHFKLTIPRLLSAQNACTRSGVCIEKCPPIGEFHSAFDRVGRYSRSTNETLAAHLVFCPDLKESSRMCIRKAIYTLRVSMRINIDIDDALMAAAIKAGGFATKKETVEEALRLLVRKQTYQGIRALRGTVRWVGDLSQMRQDRVDYREPIIVKKSLAKRLKKTAQ